MAWQIPLSTTGPGIVIDLGELDDVYVAEDVTITAPSGNAVVGTGSNHEARIYGTVVGDGNGVTLGSDSSDTGQLVAIKPGARVESLTETGVLIFGFASEVINQGA